MESERTIAEADVVNEAQRAAARRSVAPMWYWAGYGVLFSFLGLAMTVQVAVLSFSALATGAIGFRLMNWALTRSRGIRVRSLFDFDEAWLVFPFFLVLAGVLLLTITLFQRTGSWWIAGASSVLAVPATLAYGFAYNHVRLHPADAKI